jgi:hypothetical protein
MSVCVMSVTECTALRRPEIIYCGMSECEMSVHLRNEEAALWQPEIVLLWDECIRVWKECGCAMSVCELRSYYCGMSVRGMSMCVMSATECAALWRPDIVLLWDACVCVCVCGKSVCV